MSGALLLDTHIVLWLDSGDERLRPATRELIDHCWKNDGRILVSAVSAWEVALLVDTGRIDLDLPVEQWMGRFLSRPGVESVPLNYGPAARAYTLHHLEHRDPADRMLIATAIELGCPLVTYDERIARFASRHGAQYRFTLVG